MPSEMVKMSAIGGLGGMLPTLSKLATIYVTAQETPLPLPGMYVGLALFFAIGIILCIGFSISDAKQALLVGIAAPGIITNVISGVQHGTTNPAGIPQITLPSPPLKKRGSYLTPLCCRSYRLYEPRLTNLRSSRQATRMIHLRLIIHLIKNSVSVRSPENRQAASFYTLLRRLS